MAKRVPCANCGTPIIRDENGIWVNPDSPDDLPMVQCPGEPRGWHDYHYGEEN